MMVKERKDGGVLLENEGQRIILLKGSPYEMGYQHGVLLKDDVRTIVNQLVDGCQETDPDVLHEIWEAQEQFIPDRYKEELKGLADGADLSLEMVQLANIFPELYHCSGVALFGDATTTGELLHGRILDYTVDRSFQQYSLVVLQKPDQYNYFINASFVGMIGTVTGMNNKQIALGEMGVGGEGNWPGTPMTLLLRRILEEAETLGQAVSILEESKRTCEYYYVISDGKISDARSMKCIPEEMIVLKPGEDDPESLIPGLKDVVMISRGERYVALRDAISRNYGKIDKEVLIEIMKRPVSMEGNLHNAVFSPKDLKMWLAVAKEPIVEDFQACYQKYYEYDMNELLPYF